MSATVIGVGDASLARSIHLPRVLEPPELTEVGVIGEIQGAVELVIDEVVIRAETIDELKVHAREHGVEIVPTIKFATQ